MNPLQAFGMDQAYWQIATRANGLELQHVRPGVKFSSVCLHRLVFLLENSALKLAGSFVCSAMPVLQHAT